MSTVHAVWNTLRIPTKKFITYLVQDGALDRIFTLNDVKSYTKSGGRIASNIANELIRNNLFTCKENAFELTLTGLEVISHAFPPAQGDRLKTISVSDSFQPRRRKRVPKYVAFDSAEYTEEVAKVYSLALAYEKALGKYLDNPTLRYISNGRIDKTHPNYRQFLLAVKLSEEIHVSYEFFIKAQFWYYDKTFSKYPRPLQLVSLKSTKASASRVQAYRAAVVAGTVNVNSNTMGAVIRTSIAPKSSEINHNLSRNQLKTLMNRLDKTEEEILRIYAVGETAHLYFSKDFLSANPTYQRLKQSGAL